MAVVESVVKILLQKLGDQLLQEAIFLHGVGDQVELLGSEFRRMQSFLKDADAKQEGDERVKNWVRDVRDVAYDAEDIIDTFVFKIATLRRRRFVGCSIRRDACIFSELRARHKLGSEIENIKNKIRTISDSRLTYGIENTGQGAGMSSEGQSLQEWRVTSPYFPEPDFVAFEKDLEALVTRLIDVGEHRRCVVSVVGMGGLGKTTLTKKVYNDTRVQTHFDSCEWISLSQEYGVRDLLTKIINRYKRFPEEKLKKMDLFQLRHEISECLEKKRYLMVLDDIWTNQAWDALKDAFPNVNNGSRVMLTTRNKDVALHADARSPFHEPRFLNDEQSWELFCRKAFPGRNRGCPRELEELGRQIMEKCHGLPLAVVVIGGLLSRKEPGEWETVRRSISWQFIEGEDKISHILALSYKDLPYYLKPCFLYLGNYPEDYEFRTEELIQIWVAEGIIQERGELTLEEVGEHYLKELIQRSMVQVAERSSSGGIKRCRIHDLLRDLSISEAKEGMFLEVHHENTNIGTSQFRARRLVILRNNLACLSFSTPHLRSVLMYAKSHASLRREEEKFLYRGFKLLRVLYLHGLRIENLPGEIGELIHLRYLGCVKTELKSLPLSIGNLPNLQTLFVSSYNYSGDFKVPSTIGKMQQLRHLQLKCINVNVIGRGWEGFRAVIEGHPRVERISNLQTLSGVKSGKWMDGFLGNLTDLKKLEICLLTRPDADVLYRSIIYLVCLQSLSVMARGTQRLLVPPLSHLLKLSKLLLGGKLDKLPEPAEFPTNLTKLTLKNSYLKEDPMATLEKLKNLRILRLLDGSYVRTKMACSSQGFPRLKSLHLVKLNKLEEWRVEEGAMPSLLHLRIHDCEQLKKLPEGLQHVTTLKKLELWDMFSSLEERLREERGEDWHKIRHIPSIHILGEVDTELWDTAGQERYRSLIPSYIKASVAVIVYHDSGRQSFHNTWEWIEEDSD